MELGWGEVKGSASKTAESSLVSLKGDYPRRIEQLTGIRKEELAQAPDLSAVWRRFSSTLDTLSSPFLVAHFAVFERRFISDLYARYGAGSPPMMICTFELARRLLPDLPGHSLRAVAGYLGHHLPKDRRAVAHVAATQHIWSALLSRLERRGIVTLEELLDCLRDPPPSPGARKLYLLPRERLRALPRDPGVYRFENTEGEPLYIGKAASLRHRVSSYFQSPKRKARHIREMLAQAAEVRTEVTPTRLEAALLEVAEIKQHAPKYNLALSRTDDPLWFFAPDLSSESTSCDSYHRLGPFPRREPLERLLLLDRAMALEADALGGVLEWGRPFWPTLRRSHVIDGVSRLRENLPPLSRTATMIPALIALGTVYSRYRASARYEESDDEIEKPFSAARLLSRLVCPAAHLWRRASWFRWLGNSTISWRSRRPSLRDGRRVLRLEENVVSEALTVSLDAPRPDPAAESCPGARRWQGADIRTYDRLRVLTTELKRIVDTGDPVEIRFSKNRAWGPDVLPMVLEMV